MRRAIASAIAQPRRVHPSSRLMANTLPTLTTLRTAPMMVGRKYRAKFSAQGVWAPTWSLQAVKRRGT